MSLDDEIAKAISAHGIWKRWLRSAIDKEKIDVDPVEVAKDNGCPFGEWLYGTTIPATTRAGADYAAVRKLHADYHRCAAKVLECVAHGQKAQADALMTGDCALISAELTSAMAKWSVANHQIRAGLRLQCCYGRPASEIPSEPAQAPFDPVHLAENVS